MAIMLDWTSAFGQGKILKKTVRGSPPVVVYRGESGRLSMAPERCAHRGAALDAGFIDGDCVRCAYHARLQAPLEHAPLVERDGVAWMAATDIDCPQGPPEWTDPAFRTFEYTRRVESAADVMMENLLDWEHVNSVHAFAIERGDPEIVMWGDEFQGKAVYDYEGGLTLENEFWVPYTNILRFSKGNSVFVLWTSITPIDDATIDLHFRVSRNALRWIPDAAFRMMNDFVLDEDRRIVRLVPANFRGSLSEADGFIAMYRDAMSLTTPPCIPLGTQSSCLLGERRRQ